MLAKLILAVTMAASAFLGGGELCHEQTASFDGFYLYVDDFGKPSLWQETNGHACLQTAPRTVQGGLFRVEIPPDDRVLL